LRHILDAPVVNAAAADRIAGVRVLNDERDVRGVLESL
jgi:hypothetical protein